MIRLLLLHSTDSDFEAARSMEQLARGLGAEFAVDVRAIGGAGHYRNWPAALLGLRRAATEFDLIHAWDTPALLAAAMAGRGRLLHTPPAGLTRNGVRWLRAVQGQRALEVACSTATQHRLCVANGIEAERCHLLRPGVDFARVKPRRQSALREQLGFGPEERVLLPLTVSTPAANDRLAAWCAAILHELDKRHRLLFWGRGPQAQAVWRFAQRAGRPGAFVLAPQRLGRSVELEELLPAADVLLVTATGPVATLPIAIGMAAGLPIVSTVSPTVAELLEDRHTALMVPEAAPKALAQRLLDLGEDAGLQWSIADRARAEAYEFFPLTRFLKQHREVYRQTMEGRRGQVA